MEAAQDGQVPPSVQVCKSTYSDVFLSGWEAPLFCLDARMYWKILCASDEEKAIRIPMNDEYVRSLNVLQYCLHDCLWGTRQQGFKGLELSHRGEQHDKLK